MNIIVLGANGKTGRQLVELAIDRGFMVTAVTRNPAAFSGQAGVTAVTADVTDSDELAKAFAGHDAVLSTLGNNNAKLRLIERSSEAIVSAMKAAGLRRLVVELAYGAAESASMSKPTRAINELFLGKMLVDQREGVHSIQQSGLDWTIMFPTILTNGRLTEKVKVIDPDEKIRVNYKISRANVSHMMLQSLEDATSFKKALVISAA